jgi:hypothetical protein
MDQALESQWIAGAGQLGAEFFNGIGRYPPSSDCSWKLPAANAKTARAAQPGGVIQVTFVGVKATFRAANGGLANDQVSQVHRLR